MKKRISLFVFKFFTGFLLVFLVGIKANGQNYYAPKSDVTELKRKIEANKDQTNKNLEKINYEIDTLHTNFNAYNGRVNLLQDTIIPTLNKRIDNLQTTGLDRFWILICAALVFFMQAGFAVLEVGLVRKQHGDGVGVKSILGWLVLSLAFFSMGYGLMFGTTTGFIGKDGFFPFDIDNLKSKTGFGLEFVLYQLAFAGVAATIVSGALAERTALIAYLLTALFIGLAVYPVFGHWAWGSPSGEEIQASVPWLKRLGFQDFAGATVVHSIGAWVSLAGIYVIGPRTGRFYRNDKNQILVNTNSFKPNSIGYSILGVFILYLGWWGFNGGSTFKYDSESVSKIILNLNLAACASGVVAFMHAYLTDRLNTYSKTIGGVLGGLVAITACCNVVSLPASLLIGAVAAIVHNLSYDLLLKWRLDDPVGAIPVHGFCGALGTICFGIFGDTAKISKINIECFGPKLAAHLGLDKVTILEQIGYQLLGVIVAFIFTVTISFLFFSLLKRITFLRIPVELEEKGYDFFDSDKESA